MRISSIIIMHIHLPVLYTCLGSVDNSQNNLNFVMSIYSI